MPDSSSFEIENDILKLVQHAKRRDIFAYELLYQHYGPQILTFLIHMLGNEDDARELTQDTFLSAWNHLPTLKEDSYFKTWLYRIAINKAKAFFKRAEHFALLSLEERERSIVPEDRSVAGFEEQVIEREILNIALSYVSPTYRACLILKYVQDLPESKIAEVLGIPVKNVGTNIQRGLQQVSKAYGCIEAGVEPPLKRRPVE